MSRFGTFRSRVQASQLVRCGLLLVCLFALCFLLLPPPHRLSGLGVLAGVLVIPALAGDALLRRAVGFVRITEWAPFAGLAALVFARKPIAADFRLGLLAIAVLGLYLGCYFWLFSDQRFWAVVDELAESDGP